MDDKNLEKIYKDIRKRVHEKYEKRKEFAIHATIFTFSMLFVWLVIFSPNDFGDSGIFEIFATAISCLWAIGFVAHGVDFGFTEMRENAIDREIERTRLFGEGGKLKNEDIGLRLREDGEFIDFDYDAIDNDEPRQDRA
ncbi:MAG: 2TM domain-containing protein [Aggregatilineales bacterium]